MMQLTPAQKQQFLTDGYVLVRGVVPPVMVNAARRAINASVGRGMNVEDMTRFRAQGYCPELKAEAVITDLIQATPAWPLLESAIGPGRIKPVGAGQIALRFPVTRDDLQQHGPHIDGMYSPENGVKKGSISNFTALLGVLLSDLPERNAGNFTVWPGSHLAHAAYFKKHGPKALLNGMPKVKLREPVQVMGEAGDIVLAHYLLGHSIAPNVSPNVRYAIYFRVQAVDHEQTRWESMKNPWLQWPGLQPPAPPRGSKDRARPAKSKKH
jgi:hypothetical protein